MKTFVELDVLIQSGFSEAGASYKQLVNVNKIMFVSEVKEHRDAPYCRLDFSEEKSIAVKGTLSEVQRILNGGLSPASIKAFEDSYKDD